MFARHGKVLLANPNLWKIGEFLPEIVLLPCVYKDEMLNYMRDSQKSPSFFHKEIIRV